MSNKVDGGSRDLRDRAPTIGGGDRGEPAFLNRIPINWGNLDAGGGKGAMLERVKPCIIKGAEEESSLAAPTQTQGSVWMVFDN